WEIAHRGALAPAASWPETRRWTTREGPIRTTPRGAGRGRRTYLTRCGLLLRITRLIGRAIENRRKILHAKQLRDSGTSDFGFGFAAGGATRTMMCGPPDPNAKIHSLPSSEHPMIRTFVSLAVMALVTSVVLAQEAPVDPVQKKE